MGLKTFIKMPSIKDKYNILYISSFGSLRGGGQRSLLLLLKYLNKNKFRLFLVVPDRDELALAASKLGLEVFVLPFPRIRSLRLFSFFNALSKLKQIVRKNSIDIIHVDAPREAFYAHFASFAGKVKVVLHARVSDSFTWLDKIVYGLADNIIAVSSSVANRFKAFDTKKKISIVYNSVEIKHLPVFNNAGNAPDKFTIGYFGRINRRKGLEVLIKAAKEVNYPGLTLLIMGSVDEAVYLEELKHLAAGQEVIFKDYQPEIVRDMLLVDIMVLPSIKSEGLSRMLIEGMALGKIVIASDFPENREALGDDLKEFIFPVGDYLFLSQIIGSIIKNRDVVAQKKGFLRKRAEAFFDTETNVIKIEQIYLDLLKKD